MKVVDANGEIEISTQFTGEAAINEAELSGKSRRFRANFQTNKINFDFFLIS